MAVDPAHLKLGTQIAYVPNHADGDIEHPDVEFGFVTGVAETGAYCHYWKNPERFYRRPAFPSLRTRYNSELTPFDNLLVYDFVGQKIVDEAIKAYVE